MKRNYKKSRIGRTTRPRYRYGVRGKSKIARVCKRVIMRMAEPKYKLYDHGKIELYHNAGSPASGRLGNFIQLNSASQMPTQGNGDESRNGDRINLSGFAIRMSFGQKWDRPNVTFKVYVLSVNKNITPGIGTAGDPRCIEWNTGNILLDTPNTDFCTVLASKTYKPCRSTFSVDGQLVNLIPTATANSLSKEYTFARKLWIPRRMEYKFGGNQGTGAINDPNDKGIWLAIFAYDAYGTVITDNIGYCQIWQKTCYRDP